MAVKPIPDGFHTLTPHLIVNDGAKAIEFYKKAFGAKEISRMPDPTGKVAHAELQIGTSRFMLVDEYPEWGSKSAKTIGASPVTLSLYVEDADKVYNQAVAAGCTASMPIADQFWGDRYGKLVDPFGHHWAVATHKEDLKPEEIQKRAMAAMANK